MTSTVAVKANCITCTRDFVGMCRLVYTLTTAQGFTVLLLVPGVFSKVFVVITAFAGKSTNVQEDLVLVISLGLSKRWKASM